MDSYRLPSEAEWEYAARAGTTTPYSFGEMKLVLCEGGDGCEFVDVETALKKIKRDTELMLDEHAWHEGNSGGETHPVGQKKQNPWGLYDMYGNGWIWDIFGSKRVSRGCSWYGANCCRSAFRSYRGPDEPSHALGFRLLMAPALHFINLPT